GTAVIYDNVLEAMGRTPLIRLNRLSEPDAAEILVKFEGVNVGGSVKTRTAFQMIEAAEKRGQLGPDSIIVEPTSGNQGIGLALVCAVRGYAARIIMPDSVSVERRKLVQHYGAEVVVVHDDGDIGKCISECIAIAERMAAEDPRVYVPQQFENEDNLFAHRYHTALEIVEDVEGPVHGFCSGIGTGGTISGVGQILKRLYPDVRIWAVEPENAAILSGGGIGTHLQMGIGDGLIPPSWTSGSTTTSVVSDEEAIRTARALAREGACSAACPAARTWPPRAGSPARSAPARPWSRCCTRSGATSPPSCSKGNSSRAQSTAVDRLLREHAKGQQRDHDDRDDDDHGAVHAVGERRSLSERSSKRSSPFRAMRLVQRPRPNCTPTTSSPAAATAMAMLPTAGGAYAATAATAMRNST
ncbi:MAG: PLP-dependent cysteine synthase family protein, partial [Eggerthellaceae bacterium]